MFYTLAFILSFILVFHKVFAVCPVCTVSVGVGVGLSRWLGIDDTISGIWIGGLTVSLIMWTDDWLKKKSFYSRGIRVLNVLIYYLLILGSLYWLGFLKENIIYSFWLSKIILGIVVGSLVFLAGAAFHIYLREKNGGKVYFPFQKVVIPVVFLLAASVLFYFLF